LLAALSLPGCTSTPVEQMPLQSSFTIAGDRDAVRSAHASHHFALGDEVWVETVVGWDAAKANEKFEFWNWSWRTSDTSAGWHDIYWKWYSGSSIVATDERVQRFMRAPYAISGHQPAAALGSGPHRVEVYVDGRLIDTQQFDIS
jgi:hypothetical protein